MDYEELRRRCFDLVPGVSPEAVIDACGAVIAANRSREDVERAHFSRGLSRVDFLGEFEAAIEDYSEAIALTPKARYFQTRGEVLSRVGRTEEALSDFTRVIDLDPEAALAHLSIGGIHLYRGDAEAAVKSFDQAIEISPDFAAAYYSRSLAYRALGQQGAANRDLDKAIDIDPGDPLKRGVRAAVSLREAHFDRALLDLDRVLEIWPDMAIPLYMRGIARRRLGDGTGGDADLAEARRLDPDIDSLMAAEGFVP
jgi:tetratricopeptide (TPR) repeat protein